MLADSTSHNDPHLIESEARYRAVIENASDMIQSVLPDGRFEFVNPSWLNKLGYTAEEVENLIIWDVIHPSSLDHCQTMFGIVMDGNALPDVELVFKTKSGDPLPAKGSVTIREINGQIVATHAFFRDISELIRAQELEERNRELERESMARYLEKMAALGKLAAGLAHELNNPAAAVRRASAGLDEGISSRDASLAELVTNGLSADAWRLLASLATGQQRISSSDDHDDPLVVSAREEELEDWLTNQGVTDCWDLAPELVSAGITCSQLEEVAAQVPTGTLGPALKCVSSSIALRDAANVIDRGTQRISDLVSAIKAYSYMDRGLEQVADIHEGIENTLIILAHRLRDVTIRREFDRDLPPVRTMGSGLNQVWTNILDNAIDATDGHGVVSIRTYRDGDRAAIEIADNGPGIPPELLTRIFEPFFTTKSQGNGVGLGLESVWHIVTDEHHGTIEVESEPGKTVFRVRLPFEHTAE